MPKPLAHQPDRLARAEPGPTPFHKALSSPRPRPAAGRQSPLETLDDRALLARLLVLSVPGIDLHCVVERLFDRFGGLSAILAADLAELARVAELPAPNLESLKLLHLLCERMVRTEATRRSVISSWSALLAYVRVALAEAPREQFRALFLDTRNQLMSDELITYGTIDHAPVYPREVVRRALEVSASAIILVHNHPSGDATPSQADIAMTRKVIDAARVFEIKVHDHLIVSRGGTTSFQGLGLLN